MAALIRADQLKEHVETDLSDDALDRLIDDADAEIVKRHGPHVTQEDTFENVAAATAIYLSRPASSITTVTEEIRNGDGAYTSTVLSADDYKLRRNNLQVERLSDGTNSRTTWGDVVTFEYVPAADNARRIRVTIDLVRLAITYNALETEDTGDYRTASLKHEDERDALLRGLATGLSFA